MFVEVWFAVKLPVGDMASQLLRPQLCSEIWAVTLVSKAAVTVSVCDAGAAPPANALKVKAEGLTVRAAAGRLRTFRLTVTVSVMEAAMTVIVPLHVVPAAIPD